MGGRGDMTTAPMSLQDLQQRIYVKAKAEPSWRFWGLYVHVCKMETLREAYRIAKANHGAPGSDGVTFEDIEASGGAPFLEQIRDELGTRTDRPMRVRQKALPKEDGTKVRVLSIPTIRDRVVQGAFTLILEPIFAADCQPGSYGYRPKRSAHDAVLRVAEAIVQDKTRVIDVDVQAYFDNIRPHLLLAQVAQRVNDPDVLHVLTLRLQASGQKGVAQGGVLSPLLRNLYLTAVDRMLERAKEITRRGPYTYLEYTRFADALVLWVEASPQPDWLLKAVARRLREELAKLPVSIHEEKSRVVDLAHGESFSFLGFDFRRIRSRHGAWRAWYPPRLKKRTALVRKLKEMFRRYQSQPIDRVIQRINPILRGWVRYFAVGDASRCFGCVKDWVEKQVRRHLRRARKRQGFGWKRWRRQWLYQRLGLFTNYRVHRPRLKALPAREGSYPLT
jgi:RNA-directed DNA polymerase